MAVEPRAVVLLSGGLDSTTAAAYAARDGWSLYALTIKYGQVHQQELEAARRVALALGVRTHVELAVDLSAFGGSSLTGEGEIPRTAISRRRAIRTDGGPDLQVRPLFLPPTSPRATPSFSRSHWRGRRYSPPSGS